MKKAWGCSSAIPGFNPQNQKTKQKKEDDSLFVY